MIEQLIQHTKNMAVGVRRNVLARPFVRHVGVLTLANGVGAVLSFVQGILVARWLGPELYGVAALVMSVPALVYTFFDVRSAEAAVKFLGEFHARGERERATAMCRLSYLIDFGVATLAFLAVLALAPWASRVVVHRPELAWLLVVYALAFLPRALRGTSYAVLAVHERFVTIARIQILTTLIRVALVLGLVLAGWGVVGVVLGNAVGTALFGILYATPALALIARSWGSTSWLGTWFALKGYRREVARFLAFNDINALLGMIPKQLDVVLLGYFRDPTEVGFYKLAKSLAVVVSYIVHPLQSVTYPQLVKLWGQWNNISAIRMKILRLWFIIGLPLGSVVIIIAVTVLPFVLPFLVGDDYRSATFASQLLMIGYAVYLMVFWLRPVYLATGRVTRWTVLIFTFSMFNLAGWLFMIPWFGYTGLSMWWLLSVVVVYVGYGVFLFFSKNIFVCAPGKKYRAHEQNPDWEAYTARLASKGGATATDWDILRSSLRGRVLDAGCGTGITLARLLSSHTAVDYAVGIDIGFSGLKFAKKNFPQLNVLQGSLYSLPFKDGAFDSVFSIDVFEHLDNPDLAVKEVYRVCKKGAYFVVQTPNYPVKRIYDFWHVLNGSRDTWRDDPTHISKMNAWTLAKVIRSGGFSIERVVARNLPFMLDRRVAILRRLNLREGLIGKLIGQKIIIVAVKE